MKRFVCLIALATASLCCLAQQNLRSAYFLDGYTYRYRFNPAFYSQQGFAMLGIGNTSLGLESNLSLNAFLNPDKSGVLSSFMSENVSSDTFLKYVQDINKADLNGSATLLATSFWTGKVFHSIEVNARMAASAKLPREVFEMFKNTDPTRSFSLPQLSGNFNTFGEIAYGLAGDINENIHIGGRAKFLIGLANVNASISDIEMTSTGGGKFSVTGHDQAMFFLPNGTRILTKGEVAERDGSFIDPSLAKRIKFSEIELPKSAKEALTRIPGFGVAFDFGMSFDFAENFTAAFSILDLGFIQWRYGRMATMPTSTSNWNFNGMTRFNAGAPEDVKAQFDVIADDLEDVFPFEWDEEFSDSKQLQMLQFTGNVSLEYRMPFYDKLSIGAIFSAHAKVHPMSLFGKNTFSMDGMDDFDWYEGRLVASVAPLDWLSCSLDYACSNFGHSFGTALNIHCPYFNLFFGADNLIPIFFMQKKGIPSTRLNASASFGINILFGQRH